MYACELSLLCLIRPVWLVMNFDYACSRQQSVKSRDGGGQEREGVKY